MKQTIFLADKRNIARAVDYLKCGKVVALPTETVYGLCAVITNSSAISDIFSIKRRPRFNPLIVHVSDIAMAERYVIIDPLSATLMNQFWPGPLTIVLRVREKSNIHPLVTAGLETLAIRKPRGILTDLIKELDIPLAAPSANQSGKTSPTTAAAVADDLGDQVPLILDAGPCSVGVESTIIRVIEDKVYLLRLGGITRTEIEEITKKPVQRLDHTMEKIPSMLESHYALDATIRIDVKEVHEGEALLAFGPRRVIGFENAITMLNLSPSGNVKEAAIHLFDYLRKLAKIEACCIAVEPIPMDGLGEVINDRLRQAAMLQTDI